MTSCESNIANNWSEYKRGTPAVAPKNVPIIQFSVLTNHKRLLAKTLYSDGRDEPGHAWNYIFTRHSLDNLEEATRAFQYLATQPHRLMLHEQLKAGLDPHIPHRRLTQPDFNRYTRQWDQPTLDENLLRCLVPLDIDGVRVSPGLGAPNKMAEAAMYIRDFILPSLFRGVQCIATATSKTGLIGDDIARLRMFFLLAEAVENARLSAWLKQLHLKYPFIDASVCDPGHVIYTARPKFVGWKDPVPEWGRVRLLDGYEEVIAPDLPRAAPMRRKSMRPVLAVVEPLPEWLLEATEQDAGKGVQPPVTDATPRAQAAIKRIFELLADCPKAGCDDRKGGSRHWTLTATAWELACLVREDDLPWRQAMRVFLTAGRGIKHSANGTVYDREAIKRRGRDAFYRLLGHPVRLTHKG
jgi:hypothetical protein